MSGFRVQIDVLRTEATAVDGVADGVGALAATATSGAGPAAASNPGFYVSEVLGMVSEQIAVALRGAGQDLRSYAGNLTSNADAYHAAESTNTDSFTKTDG